MLWVDSEPAAVRSRISNIVHTPAKASSQRHLASSPGNVAYSFAPLVAALPRKLQLCPAIQAYRLTIFLIASFLPSRQIPLLLWPDHACVHMHVHRNAAAELPEQLAEGETVRAAIFATLDASIGVLTLSNGQFVGERGVGCREPACSMHGL